MRKACVWLILLISGAVSFTTTIGASSIQTSVFFPRGYIDLAWNAGGSFDLGLVSSLGPAIGIEENFSWKEGISL